MMSLFSSLSSEKEGDSIVKHIAAAQILSQVAS